MMSLSLLYQETDAGSSTEFGLNYIFKIIQCYSSNFPMKKTKLQSSSLAQDSILLTPSGVTLQLLLSSVQLHSFSY